VASFLTEDSRLATRGIYRQILEGRIVENFPLAFARKDGDTTWVHVNARAELDEAGRAQGTTGTMRDVTAARAVQMALEESENKFRTVAETISCIVLIFDDCIRYVNSYATKMLGWEPGEILDRPFWNLVHPEDQAMVRARGEARRRGEAVPSRYEFRVATRAASPAGWTSPRAWWCCRAGPSAWPRSSM
jgi:PAS domain-containing protein